MRKCYLSLSQVCSLCTCHMAQRNQTWSPSPCSIIYSIRKQCAGQRISKKFCNGKLLIKATKLPIQWHQFDYTHGIMEYPSCKLLRGGSTSSPSCSKKETWSCHPNQWLQELLRCSECSIPKWKGRTLRQAECDWKRNQQGDKPLSE